MKNKTQNFITLQQCLLVCLMLLPICTHAATQKSNKLTLDDAILLSVRSQPNIESSRLRYVAEKFNLWVQEWNFYPKPGFEASVFTNHNVVAGQPSTTQTTNISPTMSWSSHYGTQVAVTGINTQTDHYNPGLSLQVTQPLIRGFGKAIVDAALNNARDSEHISRLTIENTIRNSVTEVINAYLNVVLAEHNITIDQDAVKLAETSVQQTKLFIKAGHKAGNELVTVQANVATAKTQLQNDEFNLTQARYALLTAIGVDPNTQIEFDSLNVNQLINKYRLTSIDNVKSKALHNNIQYITDQILLNGQLDRNLNQANDNTRWKLDLTANLATGNGVGSGQNAGLNSIFNGYNQTQNVGLKLTIPINDQQAKQAVLNAKIAIKEAQLALRQEKWAIETNAINAWNNTVSAKKALLFAEDAQKLQEKTYNISYQKYLHGLIDSLQLQTALQSLTQAKQASLTSQINYIRSLVNMDLVMGNTLATWKINVRV